MYSNINELAWNMEKLWEGCMLASIAHAIMVAHYPELSNEHSWDGINYSIQDGEGTRGTITFDIEYCIGVFRNENSDRMKIIHNAKEYFVGATEEIVNLAENEALQYILEKVGDKLIPIITTSFWGDREKIFTVDSTEEIYNNGAFLLERQLLDLDTSIESWVEYYDMSEQQCDLLRSIFNRKINRKSEDVVLSRYDIQQIGSDNIEGLEQSKISFEEIGILWG